MKSGEKKLSETVLQFLKSNNRLGQNIQNHTIRDVWKAAFGETVNAYTESVKMLNGVLKVKVNSSPLKQELNFNKKQILEKLNAELPYQKIIDVKIY